MDKIIDILEQSLPYSRNQIVGVLSLLEEGATIAFIARYRKEATGSLDEVAILAIREAHKQATEREQRRAFILKSIEEQGKLSPELKKKIESADTLAELEDLYLPFKPRRRTRATIAREKGLEPLAELIFAQGNEWPDKEARRFVNAQKEVESEEAALAGARDIIAEWVSENQQARARMRSLFEKKAMATTKLVKGKAEEGARYRDYFNRNERISNMPSHRVLALFRAEEEKIITVSIAPEEDEALRLLENQFLQRRNANAAQVREAIHDAWSRLLGPSMENETRALMRKQADEEAIKVFGENLRQLLMEPPLGQKRVLAIDPGFRTGCKVVALGAQGQLLKNETIYPHPPQNRAAEAEIKIRGLISAHQIEAIAIGNGTAGRETEEFIHSLKLEIPVIMVNESGASVYSASDVARAEFPDYDVTVRGAVSIGRRLMDPLAELVKIDAKSIGVGQYQHDVDQTALRESLDEVVSRCVNQVGVEVNTASVQLLTYVSGLGPALSENLVKYRTEHGPFRSREELKKVPRLGAKAFEQAAGFLRIREGKNPLDASAVHPESYEVVKQMATKAACKVEDLMKQSELRSRIQLNEFVSASTGLPTLKDIMEELAKPGRDPRGVLEQMQFDSSVKTMEDLREGMLLPGIVTNVTRFGAFVDIGVHQDGLVHISELADRFVRDPAEVVKVRQKVLVRVTEVDLGRKRIALSMKNVNAG